KQLLFSIGRQLSSFLPVQLVQLILKQEKQEILPIQKKFITVCFLDIQGFTKLTDSIDADAVATILNQYLTEMTAIANKFNGTVDKFIGDGIMIIFGAPLNITPVIQVDSAIRMAQEMQSTFQKLNYQWQSTYNIDQLYLRIGIHCGIATVGSFGTHDRLTFTAIGKTVNIASRLEKLCPENSILISSDIKQLSPQLKTDNVTTITIRGIEKPLEVYTIEC
ncbi:MAG: adenylate/guanylate cyclase domain-containing protein, partial [Spirochaetota bacterium]